MSYVLGRAVGVEGAETVQSFRPSMICDALCSQAQHSTIRACADNLMTRDIDLIAVHHMFPMWYGWPRLHTGSALQPLARCCAPYFAYQQTSYKDEVLVVSTDTRMHFLISPFCCGHQENRGKPASSLGTYQVVCRRYQISLLSIQSF